MSFEIEKKYFVGNSESTLKLLNDQFGKSSFIVKSGFWWCNNYSGIENLLDIRDPKILKKEIATIRDIGEFSFPVQDYNFLRIRIINGNVYYITVKNKSLANNIEKNVEYEFEVEKDVLIHIISFLKKNSYIFYYNTKKSYEFHKNELKIELSRLKGLKNQYLEVEVTGNIENDLLLKLENSLMMFNNHSIKEEPKSYVELYFTENRSKLKNVKLSNYSRDALKELSKLLNNEV